MSQDPDATTVELSGTHQVPLPREEVWRILNDPETLRHCIRSCEEVVRHDPVHYSALFNLHLGPIRKKLKAELQVEDSRAPENYRLHSEMKAGLAGKVQGTADVTLQQKGGGTLLQYVAVVEVHGWFAGLGVHMLSGAADRYMHRFFERLGDYATRTTD